VLPPELAALDPRTFAKALFKALGMNEEDFQFGVSRVFFRPGKFAEFDTIMRADPESLVALVAKVQDWLVKAKWKKLTWACVASIKFASKIRARAGAAIIMQNVIKMYLQKNVHRHRYVGIKDLRTLTKQIEAMKETVEKMPKNKEKMMAQVDSVLKDLQDAINTIKGNGNITREAIKKLQDGLDVKINKQLESIKKEQKKQQLMAEAERLKKLAEQMEAERKLKAEAELQRKKAEEEAMLRKQMEEQQRKDQDAEAIRQEKERIQAEKDSKNKKLQDKNGEEARRAALEAAAIEQERRDQELAMRLAQDATGGEQALTEEAQAAVASGGARRAKAKAESTTFSSKKEEKVHKKHDLSKWKYADLRDTINTSVEVDLLEACREEFHRRLKVYHAWKMKNQNKNQTRAEARAPAELQSAAASRGAAPPPPKKKAKANARPQRYVVVPWPQTRSVRHAARGPHPSLPIARALSRSLYFVIRAGTSGFRLSGRVTRARLTSRRDGGLPTLTANGLHDRWSCTQRSRQCSLLLVRMTWRCASLASRRLACRASGVPRFCRASLRMSGPSVAVLRTRPSRRLRSLVP
jgi:myosin-6